MSSRAQRICIWSGILMLVMFVVGICALAGFITPSSPTASAEEIKQLFAQDRTEIRIGLWISMFAAALLVPWSAGMFIQLRRAQGRC